MMVITNARAGLGTLSRLLLGSVSDYVVKHSPCPVLVARYEEEEHNKQE
jgi:nucleotide-binding universal stress UspA family protein